jgi:putative nucleotide binding protein
MTMKEETCIILDFLPTGYPNRRRGEPIAQAIGTTYFSILELVPKEGISLKPEEEVYVGDGKRDKVRFIKGQLDYDELTNMAQSLLPELVEKLIVKNEKRFIEFFNKATIITPRMHQFELLWGVGKKNLMEILDERKKKPFDGFTDLSARVKLFSDPVKPLSKRVMDELRGNEKYYLFTPRPKRFYMEQNM